MSIITSESTDKTLSSLGGLIHVNKVLSFIDLESTVTPLLPSQEFVRSTTPYEKFQALMLGFIAGAQCLDDVERLGRDPAFVAAAGGTVNAAITYGDFLREFTEVQCRQLNDKLIENALRLRSASHPDCKEFIVDLDSTTHIQHGEKMEGLGWDYKHQWGLDGVQAFDQFGYQLWSNVRPGGTYSSVGAGEIIGAIFRKLPSPKKIKRAFRADTAFCNTEVFNACTMAEAKFVIAMKANMYNPILETVDKWERCSKNVSFYDGRECEIGHTLYMTKESINVMRVVVLRAKKKEEPGVIFERDAYDYVAWVTNYGQHEKKDEDIIRFYRYRGHTAENMIRELKNGFDLHHFPCQKLAANKAYGLIAAFAYNTVRFLSFVENPKKQHFSKLIRWKMISLPVQVVNHGRKTIFRFMKHHHQEVQLFLQKIHIKLSGMLSCSTA